LKFLAACITGAPIPTPTPDWTSLLRLADYHRLTPLVARMTRDLPKPVQVDVALQNAARVNAQRNLLLFAHTTRIAAAFQSAGIDALFLKGPLLAHQIYGDLSLRVCGDVDVLVPAGRFMEAAALLTHLGYDAGVELGESALRMHLRSQHDLAFAHADGTLVELHADLAQPHYSYHTNLEHWFRDARTIEVSGHFLRTPSAEHALLLAIIHGTKHVWTRLDLLADIAGIIRKPLDWDLVRHEVRQAGAERAAAVAGRLLRDILGISTPLLGKDRSGARLADAIAQRLVRQRDPSYWQSRIFDLAVRERPADRLRYVTNLYRKWVRP
jgi:hypothetical protein